LALLREEQPFIQSVATIRGFSPAAIGQKIAEILRGKYTSPDALPLSRKSKLVVSLARKAGKQLHHWHIGSEHLLIALYRQQTSIAGNLLLEYGFSVEIILAWYE
jgi:hypothetical protein